MNPGILNQLISKYVEMISFDSRYNHLKVLFKQHLNTYYLVGHPRNLLNIGMRYFCFVIFIIPY